MQKKSLKNLHFLADKITFFHHKYNIKNMKDSGVLDSLNQAKVTKFKLKKYYFITQNTLEHFTLELFTLE